MNNYGYRIEIMKRRDRFIHFTSRMCCAIGNRRCEACAYGQPPPILIKQDRIAHFVHRRRSQRRAILTLLDLQPLPGRAIRQHEAIEANLKQAVTRIAS